MNRRLITRAAIVAISWWLIAALMIICANTIVTDASMADRLITVALWPMPHLGQILTWIVDTVGSDSRHEPASHYLSGEQLSAGAIGIAIVYFFIVAVLALACARLTLGFRTRRPDE